jgi:hypothetical protein
MVVNAEDAPAPAPAPAVNKHGGTLNNVDVRLSLNGGGEGITNQRNETQDSEIDYDGDSSGGLAVHVLYLRAPAGGIGFAVGGGLSVFGHEGKSESSGLETSVAAIGLDIYGAFVVRPTRQWHFELPAIVLTSGSAVVETDGLKDSDDGAYGRIALQVGALIDLPLSHSTYWPGVITIRETIQKRWKLRRLI